MPHFNTLVFNRPAENVVFSAGLSSANGQHLLKSEQLVLQSHSCFALCKYNVNRYICILQFIKIFLQVIRNN